MCYVSVGHGFCPPTWWQSNAGQTLSVWLEKPLSFVRAADNGEDVDHYSADLSPD